MFTDILTLTPRQRKKLTRMAFALFTDWYEVSTDMAPVKIDKYIKASKAGEFVYFYKDDGPLRIHWFQFCVGHLAPKIEDTLSTRHKDGSLRYQRSLSQLSIGFGVHPVDFLYKEFKLIKK